jgi:hypothetical protein
LGWRTEGLLERMLGPGLQSLKPVMAACYHEESKGASRERKKKEGGRKGWVWEAQGAGRQV